MQTVADIVKIQLSLPKKTKIKLLGDSITHGVGGTGFEQNGAPIVSGFARNPNGYCWAKLFKEYMEQHYDCEVLNNACTGTDVQFIAHFFETLVDTDDDLVICTIGTNNRHQYCQDGEKPTKEAFFNAFVERLNALAEQFEKLNKPVVFVANIPASAGNEADDLACDTPYWRILHMDDINTAYKRVTSSRNLPFISMYDLFLDYCAKNAIPLDSLLCDGLHPNDAGYRVMFDLIRDALQL